MARRPGGGRRLDEAARRVRETQRAGKRQRDHAAEYQRRLARGAAKGLNRSQARGHGTLTPNAPAASQARLEAAADAFRNSKSHSVQAAAKEAGVAPERLREHLRRSGTAQKVGTKWLPTISFYAEGGFQSRVIPDSSERRLIGRYMNAVRQFDRTNSPVALAEFDRTIVADSSGVGWELETDPAVLRALLSQRDTEPFESIYGPA